MCNYNGQYSLPTNCYKIQFIFDFFSVCVSGARVLMTIRDAVSRIGYHVHIWNGHCCVIEQKEAHVVLEDRQDTYN